MNNIVIFNYCKFILWNCLFYTLWKYKFECLYSLTLSWSESTYKFQSLTLELCQQAHTSSNLSLWSFVALSGTHTSSNLSLLGFVRNTYKFQSLTFGFVKNTYMFQSLTLWLCQEHIQVPISHSLALSGTHTSSNLSLFGCQEHIQVPISHFLALSGTHTSVNVEKVGIIYVFLISDIWTCFLYYL